jgi:predicted ATPase/class 3 adenylate cyclase
MKCPRCQHDNPQGARFCEECASPLARVCSSCGTALSTTAKFCHICAHPISSTGGTPSPSPDRYTPKHLAEKILTSKTALEGERKRVTVLFADMKGSMELLAERDPEEARKLLDPVLERMMEAVHRYEGIVNQVMGDGIMALFGAPVAHEDHAVRACYAALRLQDAVRSYADEVFRDHGAVVQVRIGLNSGEVVVRSIGNDLRMDYSAVGQTTNIAARMEQLATPGTTVLSPATLELVEGHVDVRPRGPVAIKGLAAPMDVFELVGASGVRSRFHATAARGLTRFVGRKAEMERLLQALAAAHGGQGQVVAVVGEPGVGKSRLFWELTRSHHVHGWRILESGAVSYGKAAPFHPIIELLRGYFAIEQRDDVRSIREKVTGRVLGLDRALEPALPALLSLMDIGPDDREWDRLEPLQRRYRTLEGIKRLLLRESQVQPLVILVEDLHWMDAESQALLDALVDGVRAARVLLLVNYRPEYRHGWSGKAYYRQLAVEPLPPENANDLLDSVLGGDAALGPLRRLLVERTEGNPFFLEESVRTLVETSVLGGERGAYRLTRPVSSLQIPGSVQAVLAARIDRLDLEDRRLLQTAAVIGKEVPWTLLEAIAGAGEAVLRSGLGRLQAAELLLEARLFPDVEYTFKHALTHDVAYESLLHERRRALHAAVMAAMERLHAGRLGEHAELLAHHAEQAEIWAKAAPYLREAGRKAFGRSANREATAYFEHAATAFDRLPRTREVLEEAVDVRLELRTALQVLRAVDRQQACLAEALSLAEMLGDQRRLGYVLMFASLRAAISEDYAEAFRLGQQALAIGKALGDVGIHAGAYTYLAITNIGLGRFPEAIRCCEAAYALIPPERLYERFGQARLVANLSRGMLGLSLARLGRFSEGLAHATAALQIAQDAHQAYSISSSANELGHIWLGRGEYGEAERAYERSVEVWDTLQAGRWNVPVTGLAVARCRLGRLSEGLALVEEDRGSPGLGTFQLSIGAALSEIYLLNGRLDEAAACARRALTVAREKGERAFEADALHIAGEVAAAAGPHERAAAESHYRAAWSLADELGLRPLVAHCHLGLGKLDRRTDQREQAREHLVTASTMYREMGMTYWLEQAEAERR